MWALAAASVGSIVWSCIPEAEHQIGTHAFRAEVRFVAYGNEMNADLSKMRITEYVDIIHSRAEYQPIQTVNNAIHVFHRYEGCLWVLNSFGPDDRTAVNILTGPGRQTERPSDRRKDPAVQRAPAIPTGSGALVDKAEPNLKATSDLDVFGRPDWKAVHMTELNVRPNLALTDVAGDINGILRGLVSLASEIEGDEQQSGADAHSPSLIKRILRHPLSGFIDRLRSGVHALLGDKVVYLPLCGFGFAALAGLGGGLVLD